jgi:hypothetical protein
MFKTTPNKNHELLLIVTEQKAPRVSIESNCRASAESDWLKLNMQMGNCLLIVPYPFVEPQLWVHAGFSIIAENFL